MVSSLWTLPLIALLEAILGHAQNEPLTDRRFTYPNLPFQAAGNDAGPRGPQSGYNLCNSTTENQQSQCQTLILNSIDDFCMWSSNMDGDTDTIGEGEAREVAWCTKHGHGTRIIPQGALQGIQFLYAKNYLQVVGYIDQTKVNLAASDAGGELDPHGADEQGNPLGGLVYSNGFSLHADAYAQQIQSNSTPSSTYTQVIEWIDFIGNGVFCLKMCNPDDANAAKLCNHIYDEVGCTYNAIADYSQINGTYTVCDSEDMDPPGVYTTNGAVSTWFQPTVGPVGTPPYQPTQIASSNCHTFSSNQLFPASSTASGSGSGSSGSGTASATGSGSGAAHTGGSLATRVAIGATPVLVALGITLLTIIISLTA